MSEEKIERPKKPRVPESVKITVPLTAEQAVKLSGKNARANLDISEDGKSGQIVVTDVEHADYLAYQKSVVEYRAAKHEFEKARTATKIARAEKRAQNAAEKTMKGIAREARKKELIKEQEERLKAQQKRMEEKEKKLKSELAKLEAKKVQKAE